MRDRRVVVSLLTILGAACAGGCKGAPPTVGPMDAGTSPVLKIAGSTAVLPLAAEAANAFMRAHPGTALNVEAGGSRQGLARVAAGAVDIGTSDLFATGEGLSQLEDHRIAVVAFAPVANRGAYDESITSLSLAQLRGIFSGKIRDWAEVGGKPQPIVIVNRAKNSGTRGAFGAVVLGGDNFASGAEEQESSGLVQTVLLEKVGAISYLALSYRHGDLKTFAVDGVEPNPENIEQGTYPIWSYEHMYTRGPASGDARAFIDFVLSPAIQGSALEHGGFIPVVAMKVSRDHD
jgi:phosphate transport system substrate-binding protein